MNKIRPKLAPKVFKVKTVREISREEVMDLWESVLADKQTNRSVKLIVLTFAFLLLKKARENG